jgi:hypothetical protein
MAGLNQRIETHVLDEMSEVEINFVFIMKLASVSLELKTVY